MELFIAMIIIFFIAAIVYWVHDLTGIDWLGNLAGILVLVGIAALVIMAIWKTSRIQKKQSMDEDQDEDDDAYMNNPDNFNQHGAGH